MLWFPVLFRAIIGNSLLVTVLKVNWYLMKGTCISNPEVAIGKIDL